MGSQTALAVGQRSLALERGGFLGSDQEVVVSGLRQPAPRPGPEPRGP